MLSTGCPKAFFLMARLMLSNSAEAGFSSLDATVARAFFRTGSELSAGWPETGTSGFAAVVNFDLEGRPEVCISGLMIWGRAFSSTGSLSSDGAADGGFVVAAAAAGLAGADGGLAVFAATDVGLAGLVVFGAT